MAIQAKARFFTAGRVVLVFEELGQGRENLEKMLWAAQKTSFNLHAADGEARERTWSTNYELPVSVP